MQIATYRRSLPSDILVLSNLSRHIGGPLGGPAGFEKFYGQMCPDDAAGGAGHRLSAVLSRREDVSFTVNQGWYLGHQAIRDYYAAQARRTEAESALLCRLFSEKVERFTLVQRKTLGHLDNRSVSASVICVAGDMATA